MAKAPRWNGAFTQLYFNYSELDETNAPRESPCLARVFAVSGLDKRFCGCFSTGFRFENQILTLAACSGREGSVSVLDTTKGADEEALHLCCGTGDC
jgi:hypothetical protein